MQLLKDMRISAKVGSIVAVFIALCIAVTALGALNISRLSTVTLALIEHARIPQAADARFQLMLAHQYAIKAAADPANGSTMMRGGSQALKAMNAKLEELNPMLPEAQRPLYASTVVASDAYRQAIERMGAMESEGKFEDARVALKTQVQPAFDAADLAYLNMIKVLRRLQAEEAQQARTYAETTFRGMILTSMAVILVVAILSVRLVRRQITAPLTQITEAMDRLAQGDIESAVPDADRADELGGLARSFVAFRQTLIDKRVAEAEAAEQQRLVEDQRLQHDELRTAITADQATVVNAVAGGLAQLAGGDLVFRLTTPFPPAYEKLRQDFNEAMDRLQDAMTTISGAALGISAGADEISRSATDLSQRTEQQAASLEETAAALDQITAAVRRTADGAAEVNGVVATATSA
ncbi:MAG TPA: methyl-accepting chemotaxis protein, partial [Caulobacteraceae bacterium]|nr:methyl-accepting chemotaxis protein [Caulobacteraceae bacterium]